MSKYTRINCTLDWIWRRYDETKLTTPHCLVRWPHLSCRDMIKPENKNDKLWILLIINSKTSSDAQIYIFLRYALLTGFTLYTCIKTTIKVVF